MLLNTLHHWRGIELLLNHVLTAHSTPRNSQLAPSCQALSAAQLMDAHNPSQGHGTLPSQTRAITHSASRACCLLSWLLWGASLLALAEPAGALLCGSCSCSQCRAVSPANAAVAMCKQRQAVIQAGEQQTTPGGTPCRQWSVFTPTDRCGGVAAHASSPPEQAAQCSTSAQQTHKHCAPSSCKLPGYATSSVHERLLTYRICFVLGEQDSCHTRHWGGYSTNQPAPAASYEQQNCHNTSVMSRALGPTVNSLTWGGACC